MHNLQKTAILAAFVASMGVTGAASASPFLAAELAAGYQLNDKAGDAACGAAKAADEAKCGEGKCGEGKCGGEKSAPADHKDHADEAKCGADKADEAKCGADKAGEAKCGADKAGEAKCGEAKCGAEKTEE